MRAIRVADHGSPDVLDVNEIERPDPAPNEVLVRVAAAGVNPVDTYFRSGAYTPVALPFTPGVDVAGEIVETGANVTHVERGQRVMGTGIGNAEHQGSYAEYAVIPNDRVVELPAGGDIVAAGAAGVVGCTAWRALIDHGQLQPGEICLVHGGSGGVGHMAVQLANIAGAEVIATASAPYVERVQELGADTVVQYNRDDLAEAIAQHAPEGVDVVLDHRLDDYFSLDAAVAGKGARIVGIGENHPEVSLADATGARSKDLQYTLMSMFNTPDLRIPLARIGTLLARGDIEVEIDHQYPLESAATAHDTLFSESFLGKRVIIPSE